LHDSLFLPANIRNIFKKETITPSFFPITHPYLQITHPYFPIMAGYLAVCPNKKGCAGFVHCASYGDYSTTVS